MKQTNSEPVEFSCHAPEAQAVFVAGTFNDWRPEATPLRRQPDGHWRITLPLPPGHHEFKFIVEMKGERTAEKGETAIRHSRSPMQSFKHPSKNQ